MEEKLRNSMRFYLLATQLKYKIRSGWDKTHWNVSKERIESIAEHVYGTCILALSIDSEFKANLDINKIIKMLVLHELGEVIIGDITPFDNITPEEKMKKEHEAMREVIGDLVNQEEFLSLLFEFDEKKTKEAIFAHHCDKLEADIQAKVYQDMGCQHPLDEQEDNVVFKSNKVQQMVKDGAQTAFDIWYEWDKSLYYDDEDFARLLDYVRTIDTQKNF
uniref:HD domain-containing protein n=1 Tax=Candidatus Merdicola sp. TaxID=3085652 RepID=UPI003FEEEA3D